MPHAIERANVRITQDNNLRVRFQPPAEGKVNYYDVTINNFVDGVQQVNRVEAGLVKYFQLRF